MWMRRYNYHQYINEWMRAVEQNKVHSCKEIKQLMPLIRTVLEDPNVEFRAHHVEEYVRITEKYYFPLMPDQKFYASLILSLFYKDTGELVFPTVFIMAGRGWGKNGFITSLATYMMEESHGVKKYNIDIVATAEDQAMTSFNEMYDFVVDLGDKGKKLYDYNKTQITNRKTRSRLRFRTSNAKTKDGGRPGCVIFDEIHAYEDYENIKVFTGGLGKVPHPRRIYITTDGEVREGVLDDYKERATRILEGETEHNGFLPIIMKLDSIQEVGKPELWDKANPRINYNSTLKAQIESEYEEMLEIESLKEAFITKRMNIPFVSKVKTVATREDLMAASQREWLDLQGTECIGSIDFADLLDFASVGLRWKKDGKTYFRQHTFIHEKSIRLTKFNIDINECVRKGWATIIKESDYPTIPPDIIAEWFVKESQKYYIRTIKCDLFRFNAIKEAFELRGLPIQSVRSGSISHNKVAVPLQQMFAERTIVLEDDKLMRWYVWNVKVETDNKGNKTFKKIEPIKRKTDGFFCLLHSLIDDDLQEQQEPVFYDVVAY